MPQKYGGHRKGQNVENLHLDLCKQLLGEKRTTCSSAVYTEPGRYPLSTYRVYNIIKYWKYVLDSDNCIIVASYKILYNNCERFGQKNWVYFVQKYLSELVFFNTGIDKSLTDHPYSV